jgi:hypothetical protein
MGTFIQRCWQALGQLSLMDWLLGLVKSSIFGVLAGIWAALEQLPWMVSGLIAFTCSYLLWTAIQIRKELNAPAAAQTKSQTAQASLDVSEWIDHGSYFLWAAACLWANVQPENRIDAKHSAYAAMQKIKGGIDARIIVSIDGSSAMSTRILKEELIKLADYYNEKPKFLFPRKRPKKESRRAELKQLGMQMIELEGEIMSYVDANRLIKSEQELVNAYFERFFTKLNNLYEQAIKLGHQDADIKSYREHPESLRNIRHIAGCIGAMGYRLLGSH